MEPLRGQGLAVLKPDLIGALVDAYYGGKGEPPVHRLPDFTPAEDRVIQALLERMFAALNAAWADVFDLPFSRLSSESHPQFLSFLDPDAVVVVTRFLVPLPRGTSSPVALVYPHQSQKPLLRLHRIRVPTAPGEPDTLWHRRRRAALLHPA